MGAAFVPIITSVVSSLAGSLFAPSPPTPPQPAPPPPPPEPPKEEPKREPEGAVDEEVLKQRSLRRRRAASQQTALGSGKADTTQKTLLGE